LAVTKRLLIPLPSITTMRPLCVVLTSTQPAHHKNMRCVYLNIRMLVNRMKRPRSNHSRSN